ncbi:SH3 domain-containing protein [Archangium lansingense]|uniref:SH3 domain-containing protein n=1 Tax=Archangium lansingense TaxID=2995310 RepID=A0ABT3ZUQ0_9BACT|nr:SH3 domain-containing protein [Archangium lansinium]MCY1073142.1 SH3 domain-containing protein [Archangium lansinium]
MQTLLISLLLVAAASDAAAEQQRVYILGSSVNLRKAPSQEGELLEKLRIGTECHVTEKLQGEWLKVRCGDQEGYAAASLLGTEKPSVEKLRAEARNPKLKLEKRQESALRAATLSPEDVELQKELGRLFFERNLELAARIKNPTVKRTFTCSCGFQSIAVCFKECSAGSLKDVTVRVETRQNLFVVALGQAENVVVYRGKYKVDKKTEVLTGTVLDRSSAASTPVLDKALFQGVEMFRPEREDLPFGQYILDEASQALLDGLPREWGLLKRAEDGFLEFQWNDCGDRPFLLKFVPDMHGRWRLLLEEPGHDVPRRYWISAVVRRDNGLELTLEGLDGSTTRQLFKLPVGDEDDVAWLGETAYGSNFGWHPQHHVPCLQGGP